jgi:hypothetical protein
MFWPSLSYSFVIVFFIVSVVHMPHFRSTSAALRRLERAARLGFVKACPWDKKHILVDASVAVPVKVMASAKELHHRLDAASGGQHHFLAQSALAARPLLGETRFRHALAVNRAAGIAKHAHAHDSTKDKVRVSWADASEQADDKDFATTLVSRWRLLWFRAFAWHDVLLGRISVRCRYSGFVSRLAW